MLLKTLLCEAAMYLLGTQSLRALTIVTTAQFVIDTRTWKVDLSDFRIEYHCEYENTHLHFKY